MPGKYFTALNSKQGLPGKYFLEKGNKACLANIFNISFDIVEKAEGDNGAHVQRAISALAEHWEKDEYPEKTCWAS